MEISTATATEMQNNFGKYLSLVMAGQEVIVTRNSTEETLSWSLDGEPSPAVSQVEIENLHQRLLVQV